jgi:hypothetical protein
MANHGANTPALRAARIEQFVENGFVKIERAFPQKLADQARDILWRDLGCDPDDPATWTRPVVRLGMYHQPPFVEAANTPALHAAFDALVGAGRWLPCRAMGTFPVRFPSPQDPGDAGWHVDVSFGLEAPDFMEWRVNVASKGRALLMLFLFSDVGEDDAPTRIRAGSHLDVARMLAPAGEAGLTLRELVARLPETEDRPEMLATGEAGTVYLCHPFLVHAAQPHRGSRPRFMAQPPLLPREPLQLERADGAYSPVETAIRRALDRAEARLQPFAAHYACAAAGTQTGSGCVGKRLDLLRDQGVGVALGDGQFVTCLEVQPEARRIAEEAGKPKRGIGRDAAFLVQDIGDAAGWKPQSQSQPVGRHLAGRQFSLQDASRVHRSHLLVPSEIVSELDRSHLAVLERETDAPRHVGRQPASSASAHTASSLPAGSLKWKRRPPGKEKIGLTILPPAFSTASRVSSRFSE